MKKQAKLQRKINCFFENSNKEKANFFPTSGDDDVFRSQRGILLEFKFNSK